MGVMIRLAGLQACRLVSFPGHVCVCGPLVEESLSRFLLAPASNFLSIFFNFVWPVTWLKSFSSHGVVAFDEQRGIHGIPSGPF